jgi:hypothetical protein
VVVGCVHLLTTGDETQSPRAPLLLTFFQKKKDFVFQPEQVKSALSERDPHLKLRRVGA